MCLAIPATCFFSEEKTVAGHTSKDRQQFFTICIRHLSGLGVRKGHTTKEKKKHIKEQSNNSHH